jgi:hypothetical protein
MKLQSLILRNCLFVLTLILALPAFRAAAQTKTDSTPSAQAAAVPARITQAIDETQLVRLRGNVHPLARPEFDQGIAPDATPMSRMLLLLRRSPEQEAALQEFIVDQQIKDSPSFRKWLTPEQFGKQFGPADADIQTVTDWLTHQGFHDLKVGAGRTVIEFSGNVGQVRNAFHAEIHRFNANGESRQANMGDPQIPAALAPVVAGIVSLHNFPRQSMKHIAGAFTRTADGIVPQFTTSGGHFVVGPADFAKIYNIPSTLDGTGVHIGVVGDSNINPQDVTDFRNLFGLPVNPPNIILNGPDPGVGGSEGEADLDLQVSGMVAPKATVDFVVSEGTLTAAGIDLSSLYIVDNNSDDVMSLSFGQCEAGLGTAGNAFYNSIWEQAAAQGITVMVAAGDPGSAGCDDFNTESVATLGLAVSGIASTPFNVAVGGTDFDDVGKQNTFWAASTSASNQPPTRESALGYIPEVPWNDSCAAAATSATLNTVCALPAGSPLLNIVAGSGGPSSIYAKPTWQSGIIPNGIAAGDNHRYTPDVSLFASDGPQSLSFYLLCQADFPFPAGSAPSCAPDSSGHFSFLGSGGTSASSPAFAGIMALINQSQAGRQGNANPVLYRIAATAGQSCNSSTEVLSGSTCAFNDVTKGNNSVPCAANSPAGTSPNCSSSAAGTNGVLVSPASTTTSAWTTTAGYDMATGLGSVNVTNLATQWPLALANFHATITSLTVNGSTSPAPIAHGASATIKATVTSATAGTITGDVGLVAPTSVDGGIGSGTLSGSSATITTTSLPGGTYSLNARYAGDTNFASSTSSPGVTVTVNKENSRLQYGIVTFDALGNIASTNATSVVYGSPYILRMDILNSTTNVCQPLAPTPVTSGCAFDATGTVTFTDSASGTPPGTGAGTFTINSAGHAENQPIQLTGGTHALSATYSGDISYNAVTTAVTDTVMVSPATTTTTLSPGASTVQVNQAVTLSVTINSASNSTVGPTTNVTFKDGATTIGTAAVVPAGGTATAGASATAVLNTSFATTGTHTLTAVYGGDTNYATSTSAGVTVTVGQLTTTSLTISATSIASGGSVTLTATVATTSHGAGPTGTIQFQNGTSGLSAAVTCTPTAGTATATAFCTATLTTTLAFLAPPSVPDRVPNIRVLPVALAAFIILLLFLVSLRHIPAAYRRAYACAALLLLVALVAGLGGCGGYGGGGVHYDSITAVYSGDATYAGSTSSAITVTVQ